MSEGPRGKPIRSITKIMVANRGEIAYRILHTLKRLKIPSAVIYHPVDAGSPAVQLADQAVEITGPSPVAAYLDMPRILDACRAVHADAVHPGVGFLAEHPEFARQVTESGMGFIGPHPDTMALMGRKVAARAFCRDLGIPVLPAVTSRDSGDGFAEQARQIGVPLLIKAAAGGGGKGMHIVHHLDDLDHAVALARDEALRFFGNAAVYAEKYVASPRHIEVQIMGDHHGNVVHLGERDCSIQRRFQKIVEESPAPNLSPHLRQRICDTAIHIARASGYCNAGTVEFLLAPNGQFYFLEMNTRLQVEHPVTEMVTGLDLVEMQVTVARGEPLGIRQDEIRFAGHAIELRLYAEDPDNDFQPATGPLLAFDLPAGQGIRVDNGFTQGMSVSAAFDPMLAKLILLRPDRKQAIDLALSALERTLVLGVITNADYLARILSHPAYLDGDIDTDFITRYGADISPPPMTTGERDLVLAAAALSSREFMDPAFNIPDPYALMGEWRN